VQIKIQLLRIFGTWIAFVSVNLNVKLILTASLFIPIFLFAQECAQIAVRGTVRDSSERKGFYNLMVVNKTSGKGVFGHADGSFAIVAQPGDSIVLSISGYKSVRFAVRHELNCQMTQTFFIQPLAYQSNDVVIRPLKTLEQIKEERENLAFKETRTVTGINVLQSPITALYERFSKKEKSKRLVAEMEHQDDVNKVLKELLRIYVSYDIVDLSENEFIDFVNFLNISEDFLKAASDYELILFIKDKFEHYRSLNGKYIYRE
jgi:hypothetical protein